MEIEKPKVKTDDKNLNEENEYFLLAHLIFTTEHGKKFLKKLKDFYVSDKYTAPVFPTNIYNIMKDFGSVEVYSGYRAGQASVVFAIEKFVEEYKKNSLKEKKTND
jgi:hypothetical protein